MTPLDSLDPKIRG